MSGCAGGTRPQGRGTAGKCAKQTQFPAEQKEGQRLGRKGVMVNSTFDRPRQNKANLRAEPGGTRPAGRGTKGKCAKQSQSAGGAGWPSLAPRPSGLAPGPKAVVQTKPIPGGAKRGASGLQERSYGERHVQQASAKQSQFAGTAPDGRGPGESPAELSLRRIAPNRPNLRQVGREDHRQGRRP